MAKCTNGKIITQTSQDGRPLSYGAIKEGTAHAFTLLHLKGNMVFFCSFGVPCVFMIGGKTKEQESEAIFLRDGDVIIMSGFARMSYHAVPKVLPADFIFPTTDRLSEVKHCVSGWHHQGTGLVLRSSMAYLDLLPWTNLFYSSYFHRPSLEFWPSVHRLGYRPGRDLARHSFAFSSCQP